ncbi:preprotein translocase subunit SecG [Flaviflexus massiliensis]|uniref:preprotein translocase subunit SecG n=1 Tax=Flaviflexus massiliensis TaxID=1522309 RepID=UPI0006D545CC|nr:preprotein translocase subunit SecG [Flaviflexus massiliensis]
MDIIKVIVTVLLVISSLLLVLSILLQKGKGGGISDMFGGGMSSAMRSSGVAARNLNRITIGIAITWGVCVILYGLIVKFQ